jgi:hypothetical protein
MYGADMGSLRVIVEGLVVWSKSGDQVMDWLASRVDIGVSSFRFEYERGADYSGGKSFLRFKSPPPLLPSRHHTRTRTDERPCMLRRHRCCNRNCRR